MGGLLGHQVTSSSLPEIAPENFHHFFLLLQRKNVTLNSNMNMSPLLGGHLFLREQCAWQFSVFWVKDVPGSIYPLIDLDFGFDEMSSLGGGQELNDLAMYGDGIVIDYGSVEALAQDVADIHISR